jgi:hypothetical protein
MNAVTAASEVATRAVAMEVTARTPGAAVAAMTAYACVAAVCDGGDVHTTMPQRRES